MRKIEEQMIATIIAQRNEFNEFQKLGIPVPSLEKNIDNTRVVTREREDGYAVTSVYLHSNLIAQFSGMPSADGMPGVWGFTMARWATPTTKSRINAIARAFGGYGVCTRAGKHYSNGKEVSANEWF